jgi:putative membrane protein
MIFRAQPRSRSVSGYLALALKGFCMGAADVVPGVSGGTMALILGIYEELIAAIRSFDLSFFRRLLALRVREAADGVQWSFLAAVGGGILCAVFSLARALSWLLHHEPVLIWSFFFGLIVASLYTVSLRITKWRFRVFAGFVLGAVGTYLLVGLVPMSTPNAPWFLFLSGAVAICAMILPGISGAFILVLLGKYLYVLDAVNQRDVFTLALVAGGAVVGLMGFSRFLGWLLRRYHDATIAVLTGLMLGSLRKVWPWKQVPGGGGGEGAGAVVHVPVNVLPSDWGSEVAWALGLAVLGFLVVIAISRKAEGAGS